MSSLQLSSSALWFMFYVWICLPAGIRSGPFDYSNPINSSWSGIGMESGFTFFGHTINDENEKKFIDQDFTF